MARIYGRRNARRRNRNRIFTFISLAIIIGVLAYIYFPGESQTELIPNSTNTTIPSSTNSGTYSQPAPGTNNTDTSGLSLQDTTPNWAASEDVSLSIQDTSSTSHSDRVNETINTRLTVPLGNAGMSTTMQTPVQYNNSEASKLIEQANELLKQGMTQIIPARDMFNEALRSRTINAQQAQYVKKQLSDLAEDWLFNKSVLQDDPLCGYYKIKSGDRLQIIGEKNKVPFEILMTINGISDAKKIQAGKSIKILKGPFHAKVYRSTFTIDIYLKNTYVRTYKVGLGLPGSETPTGLWKVKPGGKLVEPIWTDPQGNIHYPSDPDYPLGSRWIALEGVSGEAVGKSGFAIHGTREPESLGTASSQGCIRMDNKAAVLVYNMLIPSYSTVEVLD